MATEKQRVTAIANLTHGNKKAMATTRKKARAGEPTSTERGEWPTDKPAAKAKTPATKKAAAKKQPVAKKSAAKKFPARKKTATRKKKAA